MPIIYKLINPINNDIYYIGFTTQSTQERLTGHISTRLTPTTDFILKTGLTPIIEVIEQGEHVNKAMELTYIKQFSGNGHILDNKDGLINYQKRDLEGISTKMANEISLLPKEDRYKVALNLILSELPREATYPICVRIKDIIETVLSL